MAIRVYKPTSPARRFMSVLTYEEITKKTPEKSLVEVLKKNSGRNNQGKITVRHQGGGNKVKYRIIDFKRDKTDIPAKVNAIEYDPPADFETHYTTVGGWTTEKLDRFPKAGDSFTFDRITITVLEAEPHRVNTVRADVTPAKEEDE